MSDKTSVQDLASADEDGSFKTKVLNALDDIVNLEVKTVLTPPQDNGNDTITTKINLLQGDITNTVPKSLVGPDKAMEFHSQQVAAAEQVINSNIETLKSLVNTIKEGLD